MSEKKRVYCDRYRYSDWVEEYGSVIVNGCKIISVIADPQNINYLLVFYERDDSQDNEN